MKTSIDTVSLQALLMQREGLPLRYAALIATTAVNEFSPKLIDAVSAWMNGSLTLDFCTEEASLQDIIDDVGSDCSLFEALCMLHVLEKHPDRIENVLWFLRGDELIGIGKQE